MTARRDEFDVCVIGTGAGGGVMIDRLTAAGFRVVALQRGPFLQSSDFRDDELGTIVRQQTFAADVVETWRPDAGSPTVTGRFSGVGHAVGGTLTRWAASAWRYRPDELRALTATGGVEGASLADWPVGYEELEPYYDKAEVDFGVAGTAGANPFGAPRRGAFSNPPHPPRAGSEHITRGAKRLGWHPFSTPVAINPAPFGGRSACLYGGNCAGYGCAAHAKGSTLSVSIPRALATRRLDLRPNAVAFEIAVDREKRARTVRYLDWKGRKQEVHAAHVVLAGGAIGSPHLLLLSRSAAFPQGLANSSGLVGRNLVVQGAVRVAFTVAAPALGAAGIHGHVAIDDLHPADPSRGFAGGGVVLEMNDLVAQPIRYALGAAGALPRAWGAEWKRHLRRFPRTIVVGAVLESLPVESNAVDPDPAVKDRHGLPAARLTWSPHPNDLAMREWFAKRLLDLAGACGAEEKWLVAGGEGEPPAPPDTGHVAGTCRMGEDPERSVVDRWCRAHDVGNLWIVDASTFPTAGGYPPALTVLANAHRVADRFIATAKEGKADG